MNFAEQLALAGLSFWLVALCVATAIERHKKRKEDSAWVDALISRHKKELSKHYRDGRFRSKNLWNQPR